MLKKPVSFVLVGLLICSLWAMSSAATANDNNVQAQLRQAQQQIKQLQNDLASLKKQAAWQYKAQLQQAIKNAPAPAKDATGGQLLLPAGWKIQPYGFFKFDMAYDGSSVNNGDYALWANQENRRTRADDKWSFTARQSQFGLKVFAPNIGDLKVMGRVEVDFFNSQLAKENQSTPMLRHAYATVTGDSWSLLFGQTWDVISPLNPDTLNYSVGWCQGNIGYRAPQIRFTKWWDCQDKSRFKAEVALTRQIGQDADGFGVDDGQDTSYPTVEGRLSYSTPFVADKRMEIGISGHVGKEEIDWDYPGDDDEVRTWSINTDLTLPICEVLAFKGEAFVGSNLDSVLGGIGQGVNTTTRSAIQSAGGWGQISYTPTEEWVFNVGGGMDNPRSTELQDGSRDNNIFAFANANYKFSRYLSTGLEVMYMRTDYKNADDGDNVRLQHSWKFSF